MPATAHARSDAYFEGEYWLTFWTALIKSLIFFLVLHLGWSAAWRDRVSKMTNRPFGRAFLYVILYSAVTYFLFLPMLTYEDFFREHQYGMATQNFGQWFGEQMKGFTVNVFIFGLLIAVLYSVFRRAPRTWWLWGSTVVIAFLIIGNTISPVFIEPLFNKYTPLQDPALRDPILAMARANQIPVTNVLVVDTRDRPNGSARTFPGCWARRGLRSTTI